MRTWMTAIGLVTLLGATACGEEPRPAPDRGAPGGGGSDTVYEATATVLDDGDGAELCLGGVMDSLPPQCGGPRITNWDWSDAAGEESASGVTWGDYRVLGTYDGQAFTLTESPGPPRPRDDPYPEISTPCEEPDEGWKATDPSKVSEKAQGAAIASARREPDHSGAWLDYIEEPVDEFDANAENVIINLAFTGDVERHIAETRELWGGPLCVVRFERTLDELMRIQAELSERHEEIGLLSSGLSESDNTVIVQVILVERGLQAELDETYGKGTVTLESALTPVG